MEMQLLTCGRALPSLTTWHIRIHQMFTMVVFRHNYSLCTHYERTSHTLASITLDRMALDGLLSARINFDRVKGLGSRGKCNGEICSWVIDFHVYSSDTTVER